MSNILVGYIKINKPSNMKACISELLNRAKEDSIGIWFDSEVHSEEFLDEHREKSDHLIFSITDSFKYENIHKLLLSDLCRDECSSSSKEDVEKIVALLRTMLRYTDKVDLFLGDYGCFSNEYKTNIEVSLNDFGNLLFEIINGNWIELSHFIIN